MESWEERQLELSMLDTANRNSYAVLTGSIDMESLKDDEFMLVHNPFEPETEDLTGIMEYFIQTEEYEKRIERNHRVGDHLMLIARAAPRYC